MRDNDAFVDFLLTAPAGGMRVIFGCSLPNWTVMLQVCWSGAISRVNAAYCCQGPSAVNACGKAFEFCVTSKFLTITTHQAIVLKVSFLSETGRHPPIATYSQCGLTRTYLCLISVSRRAYFSILQYTRSSIPHGATNHGLLCICSIAAYTYIHIYACRCIYH
jgi:hypothetical protein